MIIRRAIRLSLLASTALALPTNPVFAQAASGGAEKESGETGALKEIVVTAQRREERAQDIPLTVSNISSEDLERSQIKRLESLPALVPGIFISAEQGLFGVQTFIRGVGNLTGRESSVGIYVDGVYIPQALTPLLKLNDIERVEVLKGPQGTLFGRNSTGGVVQMITKEPSFNPQGSLMVGYGNYDTSEGELRYTTGLGSKVAVSLTASGLKQDEGWGRNLLLPGEFFGYTNYVASRAKLRYEITDETTVRLGGYFVKATEGVANNTWHGYPLATSGNPLTAGPVVSYAAPADFYDGRSLVPANRHTKTYGFDARFSHDFSFATFNSISAYGHVTESSWNGGLDTNYTNFNSLPEARNFSQEFQLLSRGEGNFAWQGGVYYLDTKTHVDSYVWALSAVTLASLGGSARDTVSENFVKSKAGYFQATYSLPSGTSFTAGGRYTQDEIAASAHIDLASYTSDPARPVFTKTVIGSAPTANADFDKFTWRLGVDQKFTDTIMAYASVSTGYKAGFFNNGTPFDANQSPLKPETNRLYEVGAKTELFDRRLRFNTSVFWNQITNLQANIIEVVNGIGTQVLLNAAGARSRGVDIDGALQVTDRFSARFGAEILDPTYTRFPNAPATAMLAQLETRTGPNGQPTRYVPGCTVPATGLRAGNGGNSGTCAADATGNQMQLASKLTGFIGLDYEFSAGPGKVNLSGDYSYNDGFFYDITNFLPQKSYSLVTSSLRYTMPTSFMGGSTLSFNLWGRNLTNTKYYANVRFNSGPQGVSSTPAEPRTYGLKVTADF